MSAAQISAASLFFQAATGRAKFVSACPRWLPGSRERLNFIVIAAEIISGSSKLVSLTYAISLFLFSSVQSGKYLLCI